MSQSVDQLLSVLRAPSTPTPWRVVQELEELVRLPSPDLTDRRAGLPFPTAPAEGVLVPRESPPPATPAGGTT